MGGGHHSVIRKAIVSLYMTTGEPATAADLAEWFGCSTSTVHRWIRGIMRQDGYFPGIEVGARYGRGSRGKATYEPTAATLRESFLEERAATDDQADTPAPPPPSIVHPDEQFAECDRCGERYSLAEAHRWLREVETPGGGADLHCLWRCS